jgi:hypothetical protein
MPRLKNLESAPPSAGVTPGMPRQARDDTTTDPSPLGPRGETSGGAPPAGLEDSFSVAIEPSIDDVALAYAERVLADLGINDDDDSATEHALYAHDLDVVLAIIRPLVVIAHSADLDAKRAQRAALEMFTSEIVSQREQITRMRGLIKELVAENKSAKALAQRAITALKEVNS